ncbi:hypothetical protein SAMN06265222_12128 [Neorhodopirellula lusitana]|uniref:Uncharacterized protein n=1 Tax=Neorhodopirellula lusitana TaxID=445327 RepID=A0ABY1QRA7_9BACT|nr:hypothetical protein [Neorhodopirellula lusitana]SMP76386.1 hypothetical protein SAMN06265222_12128 [Neorhodopirellula lusitana]
MKIFNLVGIALFATIPGVMAQGDDAKTSALMSLTPQHQQTVERVIEVTLQKPDGILGKPKTVFELEGVVSNTKLPELIRSPTENSQVKRADTVTCFSLNKRIPVILIRSTQANDDWWVQGVCVPDGRNRFVSSVRFGNGSTPAGTRFWIVAIYPDAEQAKELRPGLSLEQLPEGVSQSTEVEVVRNNPS